VVILTSSILVIAAACALTVVRIDDRRFGPVDPLKRPLEREEKRTAKHRRSPEKNSRCLTGQNRNDGRLENNRADGDDPDFPFGLGVHGLTNA
jgi:hypothetical protein